MLIQIINSLFPVILMLSLGTALRVSGFLTNEISHGMNRLVFWVGLPIFLFHKIASSPFESGPALNIFWGLMAATLLTALAAYVITRIRSYSGPVRGAFIQAAFRGNLAFVGIPVVSYALAGSTNTDSTQAMALLAIAPTIPIYNILAIVILTSQCQSGTKISIANLIGHIFKNPLFIACMLGLIAASIRIPIPTALGRAFQGLGQMSLPLALLGIGASLSRSSLRGSMWQSMLASVLKLAVLPLAAWAIGTLLGLSHDQMLIMLLFAACPTAVASYIMAEQMGGDEPLAASSICMSTILSFPALAAILAIFS